MKRKDLIYLSVAIAILLVSIFLVMNVGSGGKKNQELMVEVVEPVNDTYSQTLLAEIADPALHRNFAVPVDLNSELGNPNPFGN